MDFVTEHVAIGDQRDAKDGETLARAGITHVLLVAIEYTVAHPGITVLCEPWVNHWSRGMFRRAMEFLLRVEREKGRCLVACCEGIDRAPTTVAAHLIGKGIPEVEAVRTVCRARSIARPHLDWIESIQQDPASLEPDR